MQDAFTLNRIATELNCLLKNAKVNRILMPSKDLIVMSIYKGKKTSNLKISVNPSLPFVSIGEVLDNSLLTAPSFCMLLRKHLLNATLNSVSLVNFDRIMEFKFTTLKEFKEEQNYSLFIELMGRFSNAILVTEGKILGKARGNDGLSLSRPLAVGVKYKPLESEEFLSPLDPLLKEREKNYKGDNYSFIKNNIRGLSDSTAKILIELFDGKTDFVEFLHSFVLEKKQNPCVKVINGKVEDFFVFPYGEGEFIYFNSVILAQEYFLTNKEKIKKFTALKQKVLSVVSSNIKKAEKKLDKLNCDLEKSLNAEENKIKGEILTAFSYMVPPFKKSVTLENFYDNGLIEISLNESLSAIDNANYYFKKYKKQKRAVETLSKFKDLLEGELGYLNSLKEAVDYSTTIEELESYKKEIEETLEKPNNTCLKQKKQKATPFKNYQVNGVYIKAGRNNLENDKLVASSKEGSIWLHVKNGHSCHVVIEKGADEKALTIAAEICAYYSKARESGKTEVVFTDVKNVTKLKGAKPGFVVYKNFKSIIVVPNEHKELLKEDKNI